MLQNHCLHGRCPYRLAPANGVNPAQNSNADAPTGLCLQTRLTLHSYCMKSGSSAKAFSIKDMSRRENRKHHRTNLLSDSSQSSTEAPFRREQLLGPGEFNETISKETVGLKQLAIDRFWQYFLPIPMENLKKLQGLTSNVVFL